jgi:hypothetical protein
MIRRLQNAVISFSIVSQGLRRQNPKYKRGNVKGVR